MKLSNIQQVAVGRLKFNTINQKYFKEEGGRELTALEKDIKARGIQVPLIAKKDGTLLAGHRRLLIARKLRLKKVPVQFVAGKMSKSEEKKYIIKDNLLRRHLSFEQRQALYKTAIRDLPHRILIKNSSMGITEEDLMEETGLDRSTVKRDLNRMRRAREREVLPQLDIKVVNTKEVLKLKKALAAMMNVARWDNELTIAAFMELLRSAMSDLEVKTRLQQGAAKRLT
jgi:ParB-like chromosome segregation protein Spo0J